MATKRVEWKKKGSGDESDATEAPKPVEPTPVSTPNPAAVTSASEEPVTTEAGGDADGGEERSEQGKGKVGIGERKMMMLKAGKDAGFCEYAYLAPKHLKTQFQAIVKTSIDEQAEFWLKSYIKEFEGRIDEILELAEEFKAYIPEDQDSSKACYLDEFQAHVFLERRGQTLSVRELREVMRNICAFTEPTHFTFIEFLVWSFQRTLYDLFRVKPENVEGLLKGLYTAMHEYQESKALHDAKAEELEEAVRTAGDESKVVAGLVAQSALREVLTRGATRRKRDSVYHKYKQKKAQKEFEKRKAEELELKKKAEAEERKAAKERMAARLGAADTKFE